MTTNTFQVQGGNKLKGDLHPQGAKNEALQILCAVLLTKEKVTIANVPGILDVHRLIELLEGLGVLVEKLSAETGGRYWKPQELSRLPSEISYSEAGITVRDTKDLWNMPAIFLLILVLRSSEWLLRRKWGVV